MRRDPGGYAVVVTVLALLATGFAGAPTVLAAPRADGHPVGGGGAGWRLSAAADAMAAMRAARRQHSRVEIMPDRTAFSQTFANPDGTSTYVASARPRWVARGKSWVPANADLVRNADGSWSPAAAEAGLRLSGGGTGPLATVSEGARWLAVSWPAALPAPRVSGASATYRDVFAGVDLVVSAVVTGSFAETLVVRTGAAARDRGLRDLVLGVSMSKGLSQRAARTGAVVVRNAGGGAVFFSPPPVAWDSATTRVSGRTASSVAGPGRGAHVAKVGASYGARSVRMSVPAGLLSGRSTVYPVFIDPSYTVTQSWEGYGEIQSAYPAAEELNNTFDGRVSVGYDGGGVDRGNYVFGLPAAADGSTTDVLSATLTDEVLTTYVSSQVSHTVDAYYTDEYSQTSTWNNPPAQLAGPTSATFTTSSTAPDENVSWDVASWVQTDLDANGGQFSAELVNTSEADTAQFVEFSANPALSITYDHAPWAPGAPSLTPQNWAENGSLYTSSRTPNFTATASDQDGDQVAYQFQVLQGSTAVESEMSGYVASGTAGSWTSTTTLANYTTYTVEARAYDGTEYGAWSDVRTFTTDSGMPAAPSVSCAGYPSGSWTTQIPGGTTCTFSDPSPLIEGYAYSLQNGSGTATWTWTTSPTITINPVAGEYTLSFNTTDDAGVTTPVTSPPYYFGVGANGAMLAPADSSQTSTLVSLQAAAPAGYTQATFDYRLGTSGSFQAIPNNVVFQCGCAVTWPVSTSPDNVGVRTPLLNWYVTRTLGDDGPVQLEAVFTDGSGNSITTPPVTVTLNRIGTGADFGTTQVGPVTVGLQSGNAAIGATDVRISSYGVGLAVSRTFNSVIPNQASIFGWGWTSSITGGVTAPWTQLVDNGSYAVVTSVDGSNDTFTQGTTSNGVTSYTPQGAATTAHLTLTKNTSTNAFTLTSSSGTATVFSVANTSTGYDYVPATVTVPGDTSSAGFIYDTTHDATYGDPLLMVAPDAASSQPSTTACPYPPSASTWTAGCRGLSFFYDPTTGNVSQIDFVYADNTGTFHDVPVADYSYDSAGKLVAEWDPRLATPLMATYTYDETPSDADYGRITQISPPQQAGSGALAPWTLSYDDTSGDVNYGKLLTISRTHSATYGGATATTTIGYQVPLTTAAGGPINMDTTSAAASGQTDVPASAVAVFPPNHVPSSPPTSTDYQYAQIDYYDASGRQVNTADYINGSWAVSTTQYDTYGNPTSTLTATDRITALASSDPAATAGYLSTVNVYGCDNFGTVGACTSSDNQYQVLTDTYGPAHTAYAGGITQTIRTHASYSYDAAAPNSDVNSDGVPYMLVTAQTESASTGDTIPGNSDTDARTTNYTYANSTTGIGWALGTPLTTITDPSGLDLVSTSVFNTSASLYQGDNLQTGSYMPSNPGGGGTGDTETVYHTAGANGIAAACGNKPEWANLTCQTGPAAQPGTTGLPPLPVTTYTYDDYLHVAIKTETYGSTGTRITNTTYDSAERPSTQAITVTGTGMGAAIPETKTLYSAATGFATDTQTLDSTHNVTADIATTYDDFGNILTYTDPSGNTTTYTYDIGNRVTSRNDGEGTVTLSYDGSSRSPVQLTDSQAGTFAATYNPDDQVSTETYPGGLTATYSYNAIGTATSLSYNGQNWASPLQDTIVPDAHGDWATQAITDTSQSRASSQVYTYDSADRLTAVQDTLAGRCTTRTYTFNADSDRTSLATAAPATSGACQTASPVTESYSYDSADRLINTGYTYDTQGDITTTPSADAGGNGNLAATYDANDMLASHTQNGQSVTWQLDPTEGRFGAYIANGITYTDHYSDVNSNAIWVSGSDGSWTRNVQGPNGLLSATVNSSGVTLDLVDLHGDIMATASASPASTEPSATYIYNEFGVVESGAPGTYGWEGGNQISSNALGGQLLMGARAYNTNTGRFSQTDPVPGGSANAYDYSAQNPVTNADLTGEWWLFEFYHWSGHFAFGFTFYQIYLVTQGYIWGMGGLIGALCSSLAWYIAPVCLGVVGFITAVLAAEVDYNSWGAGFIEVVFSYGWRRGWWWTWYPYLAYDTTRVWY